GLLVLEHVGADLAGVLRHGDPGQREHWVRSLAIDLAQFHAAGHWHGGAQVRNITLRGGELWRIDFEENIGGALSLPLAQAYDLFQLVSSLLALRKLADDNLPALGKLLLDVYFVPQPAPAVRARLQRLARVVGGAAAVLRPAAGRLPGRDVQGCVRV